MVRLPSLELEGLRAVLDRHGFDCVDDAGDADVLVLDEKAAAEAADRRDSDAPVLLIVDPANGDSARAAFTRGIAGTVTRNA
ncbi:MAG: hypothetical protein ACREM8_08425, partial [Vulcanimicrobiaceae bacterium]